MWLPQTLRNSSGSFHHVLSNTDWTASWAKCHYQKTLQIQSDSWSVLKASSCNHCFCAHCRMNSSCRPIALSCESRRGSDVKMVQVASPNTFPACCHSAGRGWYPFQCLYSWAPSSTSPAKFDLLAARSIWGSVEIIWWVNMRKCCKCWWIVRGANGTWCEFIIVDIERNIYAIVWWA